VLDSLLPIPRWQELTAFLGKEHGRGKVRGWGGFRSGVAGWAANTDRTVSECKTRWEIDR